MTGAGQQLQPCASPPPPPALYPPNMAAASPACSSTCQHYVLHIHCSDDPVLTHSLCCCCCHHHPCCPPLPPLLLLLLLLCHRGRTCSFAQDQYGMCDSSQIANNMNVARTLGGGGALNLSPCDILPYLRGRTLWILG
jgi:hypothetical protein